MAGENLNPDPASEGDGKPKEPMVPSAALEDERHKRQRLEVELAESRGREQGVAQANSSRPADAQQKDLSAADLRVAVDEGRMTEDEAEGIRTRQSERRITSTVTASLSDQLAGQKVAERADTEIGRYKAAVPEIADKDSVQFAKLQTEFRNLVSYGRDASDPTTEALAARAAFGPIDSLEAAGRPKPRETYVETGGGRDPDEAGGDDKDGYPKDMPADSRRYYDDLIAKGAVADKAAAVKEFRYQGKHKPRYAA